MSLVNNKRKLDKLCNKNSKKSRTAHSDSDSDDNHHDMYSHDMYNFKSGNHIYFTSEVSKVSINRLSKMLNNIVADYEFTKKALNNSIVDDNKISPKPIYLHIDSPGGDLTEGFRAMDMIKNSKIPVYTVAEGEVVSAASMMYMAGKKRYITESSYLLIHQMSVSNMSGTYENIKDDYENNTQFMKKIVDIYYDACKGKLKKKQITEALKHDLYWNAKTCIAKGLADELWKSDN